MDTALETAMHDAKISCQPGEIIPTPYSQFDREKIAAALRDAQTQMRDPAKDATNPHFRSKFVSLKGVLDAVRGPLQACGIALTQGIDFEGDRVFVRTVLLHTSGQSIESRCPVLCAKPNDPQAMGSAITYARRYGVAAICGVAPSDDDDDGEGATERSQPAPKAAAKPAAASKTTDKPVTLASPFDLAEQAIAAIKNAESMLSLEIVGARIAASDFKGSDLVIAKQAYADRKKQLEAKK